MQALQTNPTAPADDVRQDPSFVRWRRVGGLVSAWIVTLAIARRSRRPPPGCFGGRHDDQNAHPVDLIVNRPSAAAPFIIGIVLVTQPGPGAYGNPFDHEYGSLGMVLKKHVRYPRVDYTALKAERAMLDRVVADFDSSAAAESGWTREQRMAFWINAYNAFTLRAIVDH